MAIIHVRTDIERFFGFMRSMDDKKLGPLFDSSLCSLQCAIKLFPEHNFQKARSVEELPDSDNHSKRAHSLARRERCDGGGKSAINITDVVVRLPTSS